MQQNERNYRWDIRLDLSPNAVTHLLNALDAYSELNGIEAPEAALHAALLEKLRNARANA